MNFKYKALLLFVILLLGLILCSFLGGNCGINHKEGFTKNTTTSGGNLNTVATYYGPNGNTAQIVKMREIDIRLLLVIVVVMIAVVTMLVATMLVEMMLVAVG